MMEAQDAQGNQLWARVTYNHATRETWAALLLRRDGTTERLTRVPNIKAKRWVAWTDYAVDLMGEGRGNTRHRIRNHFG